MSRRLPPGAFSPGIGWELEEIVPLDSTGHAITFVKKEKGRRRRWQVEVEGGKR